MHEDNREQERNVTTSRWAIKRTATPGITDTTLYFKEQYKTRALSNLSHCAALEQQGNISSCTWDYSGLGLQYQVLAGPAFVAVFTTAGVIIGVIADKFNRKIVVTICCAVLTVATGLTGAAMSYWQLVILRMTMGAGESGFSPACSSMISDMFPEAKRALALGIFNWGIYFGYGLSYAVGNFITAADIAGMRKKASYFH
nr:protein spinster homolog 1-like [Penaeus vannamei]